jgi:hypothetical protein
MFFWKRRNVLWKILPPLLAIKIADHISQVSSEIGPLEKGMNIIIPAG